MDRRKKIPTTGGEVPVNGGKNMPRTTVFLTDVLHANLECFSLTTGESKGSIVRTALAEYLQKQGMKPNQTPKVTVSY